MRKPIVESRAIIKTPAATIVAACIRAETGVGPAIASPSQTCNGNWALLPIKPQVINRPIAVEAFAGSVWKICAISTKLVVPSEVQQNIIPKRNPKSPTLFTMKAFFDASRAAAVDE